MALSEDQKAILRLLAQRGADGYGDLAALMGIGADEVHAKAQEAAAQLESEGIPAPPIPPPPGGNAPGGTAAAPAASPRQPKPEPPAPEPEPVAKAEAPEPAPKAKPRRTPPPRPNISLPGGGGARTAIGAGVLVLIALILVLVLGGGEDSGETTGEGGGGSEQTVNAADGRETTQAALAAVDGSDAEGVAVFGRVKDSLALQVEATGLEPTGKGESYTIWLYQSPRKMLPLASTRVGKEGEVAVQVEVPTEVLGYLANETFDQIDISLTTDATLKASLAKATRERKAPIYTGTDVLRGEITGPIIGAAR
jgi:hypothetical protein